MAASSDSDWFHIVDFSAGVITDSPPWVEPERGVYTAVNALFKDDGKIIGRGGAGAIESGSQTCRVTRLGTYISGGVDAIRLLFGYGIEKINGGSGSIGFVLYSINTSTGAHTQLGSQAGVMAAGKPFQHLDMIVVPLWTNVEGTVVTPHVWGGTTNNTANFTTTNGASMAAGTNSVQLTSASVSMDAGHVAYCTTGTDVYIGRVITRVDGTHVTVNPTPTGAIAAAATFNSYNSWPMSAAFGATRVYGAKFGVSFQNRIVFANIHESDTSGNNLSLFPRRIRYSILPTEQPSTGGYSHKGLTQFTMTAFEANNYIDLPSIGEILGIAKVGEGELLAFGPSIVVRITGDLSTNTATSGGNVTFDARELPNSYGMCPQGDRSIQYTKYGLIFASRDGVILYDGSRFTNLMEGRVSNEWRSQQQSASTSDVLGSAMLDDDNYLITTDGGTRICNLRLRAWSTALNVGLFDSTTDPTTPGIVWGINVFDTSSAATETNGCVIRVSDILSPSTNFDDHDGQEIQFGVSTRSYAMNAANRVKRFLAHSFQGKFSNAATVTGTVFTQGPTSGGVAIATFSGASKESHVFPLPLRGRTISYTFAQATNGSQAELHGLATRFQVMNETRESTDD